MLQLMEIFNRMPCRYTVISAKHRTNADYIAQTDGTRRLRGKANGHDLDISFHVREYTIRAQGTYNGGSVSVVFDLGDVIEMGNQITSQSGTIVGVINQRELDATVEQRSSTDAIEGTYNGHSIEILLQRMGETPDVIAQGSVVSQGQSVMFMDVLISLKEPKEV